MHLTVETHTAIQNANSIKVTAPFKFTSREIEGATLYYSRLPSGLTEEKLVKKLTKREFDFVAISECNFLCALVINTEQINSCVLVKDRFNSQRVLHVENNGNFVFGSDPTAFPIDRKTINHKAIYKALTSRVLTEVALQSNVSVLPINQGLLYENGTLKTFPVAENELRIEHLSDPISNTDAINLVKQSLNQTYQQFGSETPIAVLLSGGVDSFILAATAVQHFKRVVAYTPTWKEGDNVELPRAIRFAKHLDIEHKIVTVSSSDFSEAFEETIAFNQVPNRNYSSLVLHSLFNHVDEAHILYGEYADTLFGSYAIKSGILYAKYARLTKFLPGFILPLSVKKVVKGIEHHSLADMVRIPQITDQFVQTWAEHNEIKNFSFHNAQPSRRPFTRVDGINENLRTSCSQHMLEIETSALLKNKTIITPFYNPRMLAISNRLNDQQMFGKSGLAIRKNFKQETAGDVKPLLKELACEFINSDAIYLKKLGFPTPFPVWVKQTLDSIDRALVDNLPSSQNAEQTWSAINLSKIISL